MLRIVFVFVSTALMSFAVSSIVFAQAPAVGQRKGVGVITGAVFVDGKPAADIEVCLYRTPDTDNAEAMVRTEGNGSYRFANLPDGKYNVAFCKLGPDLFRVDQAGLPTMLKFPIREIDVSNGETVDQVNLRLRHGGAISGHVFSPDGQPQSGYQVILYFVEPSSGRIGLWGLASDADASGAFTVPCPPGSYRLFTTPAPPHARLAGKVYLNVYYPGVVDESEAKLIVVEEGSLVANQDIRLPPPVETHNVSGTFVDADTGRPVPNLNWELSGKPKDKGKFLLTSGVSDSKGEFRIVGLPSGRYQIKPSTTKPFEVINTLAAQSYYLDGEGNLDVAGSDLTGISIKFRRTMTVSGVVAYADPADAQLFKLSDLHFTAYPSTAGPVEADGSLRVTGVSPGCFVLTLQRYFKTVGQSWGINPSGAVILELQRNGHALFGRAVCVKPGEDVTGLRVIVGHSSAILRGKMEVAGGQLADGAILGVRASAERSPTFEGFGAVDTQGKFAIENLVDGEYKLSLSCEYGCGEGWWRGPTQHVVISNGKAPFVNFKISVDSRGIPIPAKQQ